MDSGNKEDLMESMYVNIRMGSSLHVFYKEKSIKKALLSIIVYQRYRYSTHKSSTKDSQHFLS